MRFWWKNPKLPRPAGAAAAASILLFGVHLYRAVQAGPVHRAPLAPPATGTPVALAPAWAPASPAPPGLMAPSTPLAGGTPEPGPPAAGPPSPAPQFPPPPATPKQPAPRIGPAAPVIGPQWKGGVLPALSPEVLRAMMDPRAARRARRLQRLGITLPEEPAPGMPGAAGPAVSGGGKPAPPAGKTLPAGAAMAKAEVRPPAGVAAASGAVTPDRASAQAARAAVAGNRATDGQPVEGAKKETEAAEPTALPANSGPPIRLQARLDRPRPEYRVGEWVALRFFASRPVHLRAYRVDAAGRVTRLFSTYSHEESGEPARSFSMMVRAGQPRPGQERVVAIGSARPLTRDELLDCLRSYLGEGPNENAAPGPEMPADGTAATAPAAPMPLSEALEAVMEAVGQSGDLPAGMAGLDRSAWSVAVGRFASTPRSLQQSAAGTAPAIEGPAR